MNKAGQIVGAFAKGKANEISDKALQPYDEVFGLQRFRETELIHGRCGQHSLPAKANSWLGPGRFVRLCQAVLCPACMSDMPECANLSYSDIHWLCRWAMLATLGVIVAEASTGVSWCAPTRTLQSLTCMH